MQEYQDSLLITVDDDFLYNKDLIKTLLSSYEKYPNAVSCIHAHEIEIDNNYPIPYNEWQDVIIPSLPSQKYIAVGVGGVLYPVKLFPKETFDKENIEKLSLTTDPLCQDRCRLMEGHLYEVYNII